MKVFAGAILSIALCLLVGCGGHDGPRLGTVSGTIQLDGQPLPQAEVTFQPDFGRVSLGKTDDQGHYTLAYTAQAQGAVVGPHTVMIVTASEAFSDETGQAGGDRPARREILPARYHAQSELTAEVKAGHNVISFDLHSDEASPSSTPIVPTR